MLIHTVIFWLKEGLNEDDRKAFFDGVEKLKDVKICWNLQNLEKMCNDIKLKKIITRKNKKIKLNHFIHYNKLSYSKKLLEITQKII